MKISELAEAAGVSKQTIHFYLRQGLLSPPVQTSRNMAYYDSRHVEEISLIKELQEERYLPLAVIKVILDSRRNGQDFHLPDHLAMMEEIFLEAKDEKGERCLTLDEMLEETGLMEEDIKKMEAAGLLTPVMLESQARYDGYDAALAQAIGRLMYWGLGPEDFPIYAQFMDLFRLEARTVHDRIIDRVDGAGHPPLKDINRASMYVKALLAAKAIREIIMEHQPSDTDVQRSGEVV
jgi:DNA-binding transcriptional MerR regulator